MKYSNRIDAEGKFYPMEFDTPSTHDLALEFALGVAGLVGMFLFVLLVFSL